MVGHDEVVGCLTLAGLQHLLGATGQRLFLIRPTGAGKTTLYRALTDALQDLGPPVLIGFKERTTLRFDHLTDDNAELLVHLARWKGRPRLGDNSVVIRLTLTMGAGNHASGSASRLRSI